MLEEGGEEEGSRVDRRSQNAAAIDIEVDPHIVSQGRHFSRRQINFALQAMIVNF